MPQNDTSILTDGSIAFEGGVNSLKPTTIQSAHNPGGLARNESAWLVNSVTRDGGIYPRSGWQPVVKVHPGTALYQGEFMYEPLGENPYLIISIGGRIYKVLPDGSNPVDLSALFHLFNPPLIDHAYFCQGEQFLVIQAGDGVTLPLFWDGAILRRSVGLNPGTAVKYNVNITNAPNIYLPPGLTGTTVVLHLSAPYPGSLNDVILWQTPDASVTIGFFKVTVIAGNDITIAYTSQRSGGLTTHTGAYLFTVQTVPPTVPELPAGYAMDYYMQRIWYVFGDQRTYTAGDIVGNQSSGTIAYNFTDSILKVTENPLAIGGDGFRLPSNGGNIRALAHSSNLNASLGEGQLYIFTRKQIYALTVPITRDDWIAASSNNQPLQTVVQIANGATGDRNVVVINGDLYFRSLEPGVRNLIAAVRYFEQPGNTPVSSPENRILQFEDRSLLKFASGIEFDNRVLMQALPQKVSQGTIFKAILPLDFTPISTFGSQLQPVWQGHWEGLDILQLATGDFGGLQRAFSTIVSRVDGSIWLWEITQGSTTENGDSRLIWQIETPAFTFGKEFDLKRLVGGEFWFDRLLGTAEIVVEYRPDGASCYIPWHAWKECSARNCSENIPPTCLPTTYPAPLSPLGDGYRNSVTLPKPPVSCDKQMTRPSDIFHQCQLRITVHGSLRIRGIYIHATAVDRKLYQNLRC
jgi:hypothetical protein